MAKCVSTCDRPCLGAEITWIVKATNNGDTAATGVQVQLTIPTGLTFKSADPSVGSFASGTLLWTVGNLAPQSLETMTVVASVSSTINFPLTATSLVSANESDSDQSNNFDTTSLTCANMTDCDCDTTVVDPLCTSPINDACTCGNLQDHVTLCTNGETFFRSFGTPTNGVVTIEEETGEYTFIPDNQTLPWSFQYQVFCRDNCTGSIQETGPFGTCTVNGGPEVRLDPSAQNVIQDTGNGLITTAGMIAGDTFVNNASWNAATGVLTLENSGANPDVVIDISSLVSSFVAVGASSYTHTNGLGTSLTFPVVSTDVGNLLSVGSDRGALFRVQDFVSTEQCGTDVFRVSTVDSRIILDLNALLECLPVHGNDQQAQAGGVAIGEYYRLAEINTLGVQGGYIKRRNN